MIQRLQSVFLFFGSGALFSSFGFPFANSQNVSQLYFSDGIFNIHDNTILLGLVVAAAFISLITIFLYNNRKLQLNLCIALILIIAGIFGFLIYSFSQFKDYSFDIGIGSPILGLVLIVLAFIYIRKDDKLVKSMDRLR
jgi:hypothetical protein